MNKVYYKEKTTQEHLKEVVGDVLSLMNKETSTTNEMRIALAKLVRERGISTHKSNVAAAEAFLSALDFSQLESYTGSVADINVEALVPYFILIVQQLEQNRGNLRIFEREEDYYENPENITWLPNWKGSNNNTIYTVSNILGMLEMGGYIRKVRGAIKYNNTHTSTCARYEVIGDLSAFLEGKQGEKIILQTPIKVINHELRKLQHLSDNEVWIVASNVRLCPCTDDYKKALKRRAAQRFLRKLYKEGKYSEEDFKANSEDLDKKHGISISTAAKVVKLYELDLTQVMHFHRDVYGGRCYHGWSNVDSKVRSRAFFRDVPEKEFYHRLVEVDGSQFNCFVLYSRFCTECMTPGTDLNRRGIVPTQALTNAVRTGCLRELLAVRMKGLYEPTSFDDPSTWINFDAIRFIKDAQEEPFKSKLKKFFLKAFNCRLGTKAASFMDYAMYQIDPNFCKWLQNLRRGFGSDCQGTSIAPYISQRYEVEFMQGVSIQHEHVEALGKKRSERSETDLGFVEYKNTFNPQNNYTAENGKLLYQGNVLSYALRGFKVKFILPIHDAVLIEKKDLKALVESFRLSALTRHLPFSPAFKVVELPTEYTERFQGEFIQSKYCSKEQREFREKVQSAKNSQMYIKQQTRSSQQVENLLGCKAFRSTSKCF